MRTLSIFTAALLSAAAWAAPPVSMVATVEPHHGKEVPVLQQGDLMVYHGKERLQTTGFVPLKGDHADLQLALLIDEAADPSLGTQFPDIRAFIDSQPPSTAIGIGFMQNGTVRMTQDFSNDHSLAVKSLRLPIGNAGAGGSPYLSLSDFVKHWPTGATRREAIMVTDGIDRLGGPGPDNPYLDAAIADARRAGVIVYAIYARGMGHSGHSFWRMNWGQNYLSQLTDQTGGEAYYLGVQSPVAFAPYLEEIGRDLQNQYLVTFVPPTVKKADFQNVKLRTEVPNADIASADAVWVKPGQ